MGYKIEFNWTLKLSPKQGFPKKLEVGKIYNFKKSEERIFPLHAPIKFCNEKSYDKIGMVEVLEFKVSKNKTEGKYKILEIV